MISVTDLRAGTTYREDGNLYQVLSYEHIKMGRGSANIKVHVKNLNNGSTVDKSYINGARVQDVLITKKELQYLYQDADNAFFMYPDTFEQINIPLFKIDGNAFLKESENFSVSFLDNEPLSVQLPPKMVFKVTETGSSMKGNSATNVFKDAILENGMKTKVPLFISEGEYIRVDTRTGAYTEKASSPKG